jgi:Fur family ferric uptake transcriptional regulator/Fur family peroxide stress response transcriptional regulator
MEDALRRRTTRQRRLVFEAVAATDAHPTAEWVYERVRRSLPRISLGTVYRNLQLLVAEGRLCSWTRGRTTRYDADLSAHDHFSCRECGLLLDLERTPRAFVEERRLRARGHEIEDRVLEFVGICRDCRHRRKAGGRKRSAGGKIEPRVRSFG